MIKIPNYKKEKDYNHKDTAERYAEKRRLEGYFVKITKKRSYLGSFYSVSTKPNPQKEQKKFTVHKLSYAEQKIAEGKGTLSLKMEFADRDGYEKIAKRLRKEGYEVHVLHNGYGNRYRYRILKRKKRK